jgi:hypothetical protein
VALASKTIPDLILRILGNGNGNRFDDDIKPIVLGHGAAVQESELAVKPGSRSPLALADARKITLVWKYYAG